MQLCQNKRNWTSILKSVFFSVVCVGCFPAKIQTKTTTVQFNDTQPINNENKLFITNDHEHAVNKHSFLHIFALCFNIY